MDDEGDFKKARGFLLTYSALVLALWYFGANLTQFKLMGNEVQLHQRTTSAWLVLALVNIYFWFRCYQRVPPYGLYFDSTMNKLYDEALEWVAGKFKHKALMREVHNDLVEKYDPSTEMRFSSKTIKIKVNEHNQGGSASELRQLSRAARTAVALNATYEILENDFWRQYAGHGRVIYEPSALITWPLKAFVITRGAFVTPWFTDHIAPLVLGGISTLLALWKWYDVNFLANSLYHGTLICI